MREIFLLLFLVLLVIPTTTATWEEDTKIVSGLGDIGSYSSPSFFNDSGTFKMVMGAYDNNFYGYDWDLSIWSVNTTIISGIPSSSFSWTPSIFPLGNSFGLIKGTQFGGGNGYDWTGAGWIDNNTLETGLYWGQYNPLGDNYIMYTVYNDGGVLKIIMGNIGGTFYGAQHNGTSWVENTSLISGLGDVGSRSSPYVYIYNDSFRLITGNASGDFTGFEWSGSTWIVNSIITDGLSNVGTHSAPILYYNGTNLHLISGSSVGNFTGYSLVNSFPIVSSATISPLPANDTDNLTALNGSTSDADGDQISLYYKWYKNNVQQSELNNISVVLANNTTAGEVWKVGIIPNDGFDNGIEVQSATVTIGSTNIAPTLTGIEANASIKYNKTILITTIGASDPNGDNYTLSIGATSGATDLCINGNVTNGTQATCAFLIPWASGTHAVYGFINDGQDTSAVYYALITVDTTPPVIGTTSLSSISILAGENLTITSSATVANGSISTVYAVINGVNYVMSGSNGTYTYVFNTQAGGEYSITYSATDDSGNIGYKLTPDTFQIIPSEGSGGGGGGSGNITINETVLGDLELSPNLLDSYFFYTGIGESQIATRTITANRNITSCTMTPNDIATCDITGANNNIIIVNISINDSIQFYDGTLSVIDASGYTATASIKIRVRNLFASKELSEPFYVGESFANILKPFATTKDGYIIGLRWWAMIALLMSLIALVIHYSNK